MDLVEGNIPWVEMGRTKECFREFVTEYDLKDLSEVEAVPMDMKASYRSLFSAYLPHVVIVYDLYYVQAQFGREVLGVVRLEEARSHREKVKRFLGISLSQSLLNASFERKRSVAQN